MFWVCSGKCSDVLVKCSSACSPTCKSRRTTSSVCWGICICYRVPPAGGGGEKIIPTQVKFQPVKGVQGATIVVDVTVEKVKTVRMLTHLLYIRSPHHGILFFYALVACSPVRYSRQC